MVAERGEAGGGQRCRGRTAVVRRWDDDDDDGGDDEERTGGGCDAHKHKQSRRRQRERLAHEMDGERGVSH